MWHRGRSIGVAVLACVSVACGGIGTPRPPTAGPTPSASAASAAPSGTATSPSPSAPPSSVKPSPTKSSIKPTPLGDLTMVRTGSCRWYLDGDGKLWLMPLLRVTWTGPLPFPFHAFNMSTSPGSASAGGPVPESGPFDMSADPRIALFTWSIGRVTPSVFAGHTVTITANLDPATLNDVAETNESNNTLVMRFYLPATGYSTTETTVPCD